MLKVAGDNASTEEARSEIQAELANHHDKAAQGYSLLLSDSQKSKTYPRTTVITFDLQTTETLPKLRREKLVQG